jgi:hypothetical protein
MQPIRDLILSQKNPIQNITPLPLFEDDFQYQPAA